MTKSWRVLIATATGLLLLGTLVLALLVSYVGLPRADVPADHLLLSSVPEALEEYSGGWELVSARVQREDVGLVSTWQAGGALSSQEVGRYRSPIVAEWYFRSYHRRGQHRRMFGGDLVRVVDIPVPGADTSTIHCGHIGRSRTELLEDCQVWVMRARYGQYVVNFEVFGVRMDSGVFTRIIQDVDQHVTRVLREGS